MKNKIKKILTTALLSVTATSAIGCANTNTKIAKKINNGVEDFVSSINKLDYVETNNTNTSSNIGKIVSAVAEENLYSKMTTNTNIENTITRPTERSDNFKLYVLSTSPYITLTSDDNNLNFSMQVSTEKIETTSDDINNKINQLILKRAILMIYVNEIYSGNVSLSEENRKSINAYVNIIKENASFLNGNRGMVKNQLGMASNLLNKESEDNIVNYYIIKSGEALEIRSNKIESSISAIDSIISILEQNLTPNSCYYHNNLTTSYQNMVTKIEKQELNSDDEILAKNIAESINMIKPSNNTTNTEVNSRTTYPIQRNTAMQNNQSNNINNNNCIDCKNSSETNNSTNNTRANISSNQNIQTLESHEEIKNKNTTINSNEQNIKTQNTVENSQILNKNGDYLNNSTNTVRRRASMARRNRSVNNNQNTTNNPTMNIDNLTPTNNFNNQNNTTQRNNTNTQTTRQMSTDNNELNRATRVPYRVSTNHVPD